MGTAHIDLSDFTLIGADPTRDPDEQVQNCVYGGFTKADPPRIAQLTGTLPNGVQVTNQKVKVVDYVNNAGVLCGQLIVPIYGAGGRIDAAAKALAVTEFWLAEADGTITAQFSGLAPINFNTLVATFVHRASTDGLYEDLMALTAGSAVGTGGTGNDVFNFSVGASLVTGDLGDDMLVKLGRGNVDFDGGLGVDVLSFAPRQTLFSPNPLIRQLVVNLATGTGFNPYGGTLTLSGVENVIGTGAADRITGDDLDNRIGDGLDDRGADVVFARGGNDVVMVHDLALASANGGAGFDTLMFFDNIDLTDAGTMARYVGFEKFEMLHFYIINGTGNTLTGDGGDNWFVADDGLDTLIGGGGDDTLDGGNANNFDFSKGADVAVFSGAQSDYTITVLGGTLTITDNRAGSPDGTDTLISIETLRFTSGDLSVAAFAPNLGITVTGTNQSDQLNGSVRNDTVYGLGGDDILYGGGGGDDVMFGGTGNDIYYDYGLQSTIVERAGQGTDTIYFGLGSGITSYSLRQLKDVENLRYQDFTGATDNLTVTGNAMNNILESGDFDDVVTAGDGDDSLLGRSGEDVLLGGNGNDTLNGGFNLGVNSGQDVMTGGAGSDVFFFNNVFESGTSAGARDIITDFNANAMDRIDLSTIDAIPGGVHDPLSFIKGAAFTTTGQVRTFIQGGTTFVEVNSSGDLAAEMVIELTGVVNIRIDDLIL